MTTRYFVAPLPLQSPGYSSLAAALAAADTLSLAGTYVAVVRQDAAGTCMEVRIVDVRRLGATIQTEECCHELG